MSYGKRFGRAAMLSLEEVVVPAEEPVVVEPAAEPAAAEAVEADVMSDMGDMDELDEETEVIEANSDEVQETVEDATSATDDAENLEAVADQLEGTLEEGGALPQTIAVAEVAVESYIKNLTGRKPTKRVLLSLESYGGINQRQQATRLAIENIREWASKAWDAIVQMFKKAMGFLKGLIEKFTSGFATLKNKVKAMRTAVAENKGKIEKFGPEISIPRRVWVNLQLGGKFTKELFFKGIANTRKMLARVIAWFKVGRKTIADAKITEELKAAATGDAELGASIDSKDLATTTAAMGKKASVEEGVVTVTYMEDMPGDASFEFVGPDFNYPDGLDAIDRKMRAGVTMDVNIIIEASEAASDVTDVKIKSFTPNELNKALTEIEGIISDAEELSGASQETQKTLNELLKDAEAAAKIDGEKKGGAFRRATSAAQGFFSRAARSLAKPIGIVIRFVRAVIGNYLAGIGIVLTIMGIGTTIAGVAVSKAATVVAGA